ncbi:MAG: hypothetical protein Q7W45_05905 [Bacteroidota bacterium]|nr:hypothetical protein [Bacteroidota bacterium]MDP3144981.1 hypothetical protein [Bacteroidota bacterium]MDP3556013.1 hypothetical protein [Bacteroidota bacterium]
MKNLFITSLFLLIFISCKKKETVVEEPTPNPTPTVSCPTCSFPDTVWTSSATGPKLVFKFKFDSTQIRLNNLGLASTIPSTNAAQSPVFNGLSAHYIEMAQNDFTAVGQGKVLYKAEETMCGGSTAIVFCKSVVAKDGDVFFSVPIASVTPGTYKWLRVSLAYQNYDIKIKTTSAGVINGTIASFVGFNTYLTKYKMHNAVMTPTLNGAGNKLQGYWGFYANVLSTEVKSEGQAPQTTVVNPNNANSPIPAGSCLVTGEFVTNANQTVGAPLTITGSETQDIIITVSLSTNKSFEWKELTYDGLFQPEIGETVVDMGLRGLKPMY